MSAIQPSSKGPIGETPEPGPAPEFHAPPKRRIPAPYIAGAIVMSVSAATIFAMRPSITWVSGASKIDECESPMMSDDTIGSSF